MRKPVLIAAVAGAAAVITIGAISLNGEKKPAVDPVSAAPRPAADDSTIMRTRPPRLEPSEAEAIPERPERSMELAERPEQEQDERTGRDRWRPRLGDRPMSAEEWSERFERMQARRQEFMDRFDTDGDGEISEEEREAIRDFWRQRREEERERRLVERFDADGDGILNEDERMVAEAEMEARRVERQARMTERFDTDGDGQLSEAESQAARESFRRGRGGDDRGGNPGDRWRRAIEQYDRDGDGELNLDESYDAYLDQFDQRTRREFVRRYDTNDNGGIDASDLNAFMERYKAEDPSTDINGDGRIDERDVERFRDLMFATTP